nr:putative integron gene cassette protein [uncultured bacterium]
MGASSALRDRVVLWRSGGNGILLRGNWATIHKQWTSRYWARSIIGSSDKLYGCVSRPSDRIGSIARGRRCGLFCMDVDRNQHRTQRHGQVRSREWD